MIFISYCEKIILLIYLSPFISLISHKTAEMCCFHALKKRWCIWTKSGEIVHLHHDHGAYGRHHLIKVNRFCIVRFSDDLMNLYFVDTIRMRFWMIDTPWIQLLLSCRVRLLPKQIKNQENIHVFALNHWWRWKMMSIE